MIGLYYYRARYYDPFTGRFLQTDPVGYADGMNLYSYCGNNPVAFVDPSGTKTTLNDFLVTPNLLLSWYFFGGGETLKITGIGVDAFCHFDEVWKKNVRESLEGEALECLICARETGELSGSFNVDWFLTKFNDAFTIENLANWAVHGCKVHTIGSYVTDPCENSVTISVKFKIHDTMDFHPYIPIVKPEGYGIDTLGTLATIAWNYATTIGKYRKAQPYELYLESSVWTTTFYFNDSNDLIMVTGFLGPWEKDPGG